MDWTGSEGQRREQGVCLPPTLVPNKTPRFLVPAGTVVGVQRVMAGGPWRAHRTKAELRFERFERRVGPCYEFRHLGWFLRVRCGLVVHGEAS